MVDEAWRGRRVVRLKAGDPFVFGRGGEEIAVLAHARVPFDIVPGVSSATAAPALAGIPVTHRDVASGFLVVSGHAPSAYGPILERTTPDSVTIVVLMGGAERTGIRQALTRGGWPAGTPAAVVSGASQPGQRSWTGTLGTLDEAEVPPSQEDPSVIIIGRVVSHAIPPLTVPIVSEETSWQPLTIPRR
jgi:uroporphyrin-III C-methyltransferase/precorrin-2 dehydrogenase/sirohydrochlorin ferrochelatase